MKYVLPSPSVPYAPPDHPRPIGPQEPLDVRRAREALADRRYDLERSNADTRHVRLVIVTRREIYCDMSCPNLEFNRDKDLECDLFGELDADEIGTLRSTPCRSAEREYDDAISAAVDDYRYGS